MEYKVRQATARDRRETAERDGADQDGSAARQDEFLRSIDPALPEKRTVTIRLDSDVLEWFKGQGRGYQTRINKVLRRYMEAHRDGGGRFSNR